MVLPGDLDLEEVISKLTLRMRRLGRVARQREEASYMLGVTNYWGCSGTHILGYFWR